MSRVAKFWPLLPILLAGGLPSTVFAAPGLALSVSSYSYGNVDIGSQSSPALVTVSNPGTSTVTFSSWTIDGVNAADYFKWTSCGSTLAVGATCKLQVWLQPRDLGIRKAGLKVASNASSTPAAIALDGTGIQAQGILDFSPATVSLLQGGTTAVVRVARTGGGTGAISVNYTTVDGSAVAGGEYTANSGTLSWADGDVARKVIRIPLATAPVFAGQRHFGVKISGVTGGAWIGPTATALVTISGGRSPQPASDLAAALGRPARLLVGLGSGNGTDVIASQGLTPDFYDQYLDGVGGSDWTTWNSPAGQYVTEVAKKADAMHAVPMFTLYQMAARGGGNLSVLSDSAFMATYWKNAKLLFQRLATYGQPAVVNLEPDFWGFARRKATNDDPKTVFAYVESAPDCVGLGNHVAGVAQCLVHLARLYAPKVVVGFPPSDWEGEDPAIRFMNRLGADQADLMIAQTLDRDAGCFEASASSCTRSGSGWYWDETNATHPNFQDHFADVKALRDGMGALPVLWWQTPMGVPSNTSGGTSQHYRDNRVHYFLTHATELVDIGGLGVVFSTGANGMTSIATDNGQFRTLSRSYFASPAGLP